MGFSFEVDKPGDIERMLKKAQSEIESKGGTFSGTTKSGRISVSGVNGSYLVTSDAIEITITDKPFLATEGMIKSEIKKALGLC